MLQIMIYLVRVSIILQHVELMQGFMRIHTIRFFMFAFQPGVLVREQFVFGVNVSNVFRIIW